MEPSEPVPGESQEPDHARPGTVRPKLGMVLIVLGLSVGGSWTLAMFFGESLLHGLGGPPPSGFAYPGTVLTALATVALIAAGVVLMRTSGLANGVLAGKHVVAMAILLTGAAVAAYLFGFVACVVNAS